jgi:Spy/CpxP family protein refolding chaperone
MDESIRMKLAISTTVLLAATIAAVAQTHEHGRSPYAGMRDRQIKSLSREQIADLQQGRGMGLALVAELNGYPGPTHVIELAPQLNLDAGQIAALQGLFDQMKRDTVPLGEALLAKESELDGLFALNQATAEKVTALTSEIGAIQGRLRNSHLKYHLATKQLMSANQIAGYAHLRGYSAGTRTHGVHK